MTAINTAFSVFSAIGFILAIVPLYWHLESWNVGTCMYMVWTALACLVHFVDSILWNGNAINWAPVWCDIGTFSRPFARFLSLTNFIQLFGFKSPLPSRGLLVVSVSSAAFIISPLQPP